MCPTRFDIGYVSKTVIYVAVIALANLIFILHPLHHRLQYDVPCYFSPDK